MTEFTPDTTWYQAVVTDSRALSGASVTEFVKPLIKRLRATAVVMSDLVGAVGDLTDTEGEVLSSDEFFRRTAQAIQFDWAFLFLYAKPPSQPEGAGLDPKVAMQRADLTIRLADDQYFYVYGRDQKLMEDLKRSYPTADFKAGSFSDLDIPY